MKLLLRVKPIYLYRRKKITKGCLGINLFLKKV